MDKTYIVAEDLEDFIQKKLNSKDPVNGFGHDAVEILAEIYTIKCCSEEKDIVKIVRCKDCIWSTDHGIGGLSCDHPDNRNPCGCRPDDFCNDGERKVEPNEVSTIH